MIFRLKIRQWSAFKKPYHSKNVTKINLIIQKTAYLRQKLQKKLLPQKKEAGRGYFPVPLPVKWLMLRQINCCRTAGC